MPRTWPKHRTPGHELVVTTVRVAGRIGKAADRFLERYDLSLAQFNILTVLATHPQGLPQTRIGDELVVSRANVTSLVRRLLARGLVRIAEEAGDARVKKVQNTPQGGRLLQEIEGPYLTEIRRITKTLRAAGARGALRTLRQIEEGL